MQYLRAKGKLTVQIEESTDAKDKVIWLYVLWQRSENTKYSIVWSRKTTVKFLNV
jgi:hypothetical protein